MSQASPEVAPPITIGQELRLVLFGMPGAGKTSLLGALSQAAQAQEHLLHGRLTEQSPGLASLRQQVYDETTKPTPEEVVLYPVDFKPFEEDQTLKAILIDCDGRVANDLLLRRQSLSPDSADGPLSQQVLTADTLVLVIDASEPPNQMDADFVEFGRFLRQLERGRGQRSEVGGLPVFLVLTKCDLLIQPKDAPVDWIERIEERKRQVGQRFREFLARKETEDGPLPFGQIDLHLWATAVKRPSLANTPARPREPYGVAELFRQCIESARRFHQRRRQSSRRLLWTVSGALGLVALLMALTGILAVTAYFNQKTEIAAAPIRALQTKIDNYRVSEGQTVADRLKGPPPQLRQKVAVLTELRNDANFGKLTPEMQEHVKERLQELQDYHAYQDKLLNLRRRPVEARSEPELSEIQQTLKNDLPVPRTAWSQTEAARLHEDYLKQIGEMIRAVDNVTEWYKQRLREGEKLLTFMGRSAPAIDWRDWQGEVEKLFAQAEAPPFRATERLPGPGSPTYGETVFHFERVKETQKDWEDVKRQLQRVYDLSMALGLAGQVPGRPAPLAIPRKPPFLLADARDRLQKLKEAYPSYKEEFTTARLPEAVVNEVKQSAGTSYESLLEAGRDAVLRQLQQAGSGDRETLARWAEVRKWLQKDPEELRSWRELATILAGLKEGSRVDPVTDLADFLGKDRFPIELKRLTLEIPDSWKVRPVGPLSLVHPPTSKTAPAAVFEIIGTAQRDPQRRVTTYTLRPAEGQGALTYRPGEELWALIPLKDADNRDWLFTWARSRSEMFQHERLIRPPRLHRKDMENTSGELAVGVVLKPTEGLGIPPVPDLMPAVRLEKK